MNARSLWAAAIVVVAFHFSVTGCDHDATAPTPDTPINGLEFEQFAADSLLITFDVTVGFDRATLYVSDTSLPSAPFLEVTSLDSGDPRRFGIRWRDWFSTNAGGYVMVRIYYGASGQQQYSWTRFFAPEA